MTFHEVVVISRGTDLSVVLSSLIAQDITSPLHLVLDQLPNQRDGFLLDVLRRTGWDVHLHLQDQPGIGTARYEAARHLRGSVVVSLDDDAVLSPSSAIRQLVAAAPKHSFSTPIIRYVHNFQASGIPGHQEIWDLVEPDDPRVLRSVAAVGPGWERVYEFGRDTPTTSLGGTAFACASNRYRDGVQGLLNWKVGGEDAYLGQKLCAEWGPGLTLTGVYAYHVGVFSLAEWGFDQMGERVLRGDPEVFRRYAAT